VSPPVGYYFYKVILSHTGSGSPAAGSRRIIPFPHLFVSLPVPSARVIVPVGPPVTK
jgi:hypothetical protein